jgi:hypothetical protein
MSLFSAASDFGRNDFFIDEMDGNPDLDENPRERIARTSSSAWAARSFVILA